MGVCCGRHVRGRRSQASDRLGFDTLGLPLPAMQRSWLLLALAVGAAAQSSNVSDSLLWGAYRPNLYFGMRPQVPQSLMTGIMWFGTHDYQSFSSQS